MHTCLYIHMHTCIALLGNHRIWQWWWHNKKKSRSSVTLQSNTLTRGFFYCLQYNWIGIIQMLQVNKNLSLSFAVLSFTNFDFNLTLNFTYNGVISHECAGLVSSGILSQISPFFQNVCASFIQFLDIKIEHMGFFDSQVPACYTLCLFSSPWLWVCHGKWEIFQ